MPIIVDHIHKSIHKKKILEDVSLTLNEGEVCGIVGRNGSGKTMLIRAISGLMKLDSGTISYRGKVLHQDFSVLPDMGLILENCGLYPEFTGRKNLELLAVLQKKIRVDQIPESLERVGLDPADRRSYRKYSLGMKQRLAIAQAIMEDPAVLLLDEPTNALDESGVAMLRELVLEKKKAGAIILLASHSREDMELLADVVYRMDGGRLGEARE